MLSVVTAGRTVTCSLFGLVFLAIQVCNFCAWYRKAVHVTLVSSDTCHCYVQPIQSFCLSVTKQILDSSVQDGMYALRKSPYVLHPISQKFPQHCLWNSFDVHLIDDVPLSSFRGKLSSASSFNASLLQAVNGVTSLALCLQVVSQASQHFRSSEKQATSDCEGCIACQSIYSVISLALNTRS